MKIVKQKYRGLDIYVYQELKTIEVLVNDTSFGNTEKSITNISIISEYIVNRNYNYIVFNKLETDIELNPRLYDYIKKVIYKQFKEEGIRKVIFVVNKYLYDKIYHKFKPESSFMFGLTSHKSVFDWIEKQYKI